MAQKELPQAISMKPVPPPGRTIHEVWGETKKSKEARAQWYRDNEERKKELKKHQNRTMTLIQQKEAGL